MGPRVSLVSRGVLRSVSRHSLPSPMSISHCHARLRRFSRRARTKTASKGRGEEKDGGGRRTREAVNGDTARGQAAKKAEEEARAKSREEEAQREVEEALRMQ